MSFKVPVFQPLVNTLDMHQWFTDFFSFWATSDLYATYTIPINSWDMVATTAVSLSFGTQIDFKRIRHISAIIVNDTQARRYDSSMVKDGLDFAFADSTDITLSRTAGGFFDSTDFDDTSISGGEIIIWT